MSINKVTLFQLFIIALSLASVIGSKVNRERQLRQQHQKDAAEFGYFSDSHGLPTKFGDEDDVIFAKKHNDSGSQHLPGATIGQSSVSNVKPSLQGHESNYDDYDYEEELDHHEENDSHGKDDDANGHGLDSSDFTDGFDGDAIDHIESFGEGSDTTSSLPVFLVEPQSTYVIRNRPAVLQCKASHAFQISFKCSGGNKPPLTSLETHVDPHTGVQLQEASTTITREQVDEFFGRGPFKCDCHARSSRGVVRTQPATIQVAYIKRQISITPKSIRVELGGRAEIICNVNATPVAKISWLKNGIPLVANPPVVITVDDKVLIAQVTMQDMANYTCVAENIAGKRVSDPVSLTVYVDGGWGSWGLWTDCKCPGHPKQGQKRTRVCNNPLPLNSGAPCVGYNTETTSDCLPCSAGRWSQWSEWSECAPDCTQTRHRSCIGGPVVASSSSSSSAAAALVANTTLDKQPYDGSTINCVGKSLQSAKCTGGACNYSVQGSNWTIYVGLALTAAICIAIGAGLMRLARRKKTIPAYNLARSEMPSEYFPTESKKLTHFQPDLTQNTVAINYEYPLTPHHQPTSQHHLLQHQQQQQSAHHGMLTTASATGPQQNPTLPGHHQSNSLKNSLPFPRSNSEHHYDVPHLCNNYMYPLDKISINESYSSSSYSKRVCSVESLATSTNTSGDSNYDQALVVNSTLPAAIDQTSNGLRTTDYTQMTLTPAGALMRLNTYCVAVLIPEGAISKHQKQSVVLSIVKDDKFSIQSQRSRITFLSPVVFCGPPDTKVHKPIVLKAPP